MACIGLWHEIARALVDPHPTGEGGTKTGGAFSARTRGRSGFMSERASRAMVRNGNVRSEGLVSSGDADVQHG